MKQKVKQIKVDYLISLLDKKKSLVIPDMIHVIKVNELLSGGLVKGRKNGEMTTIIL
jgi:hypothetical protein